MFNHALYVSNGHCADQVGRSPLHNPIMDIGIYCIPINPVSLYVSIIADCWNSDLGSLNKPIIVRISLPARRVPNLSTADHRRSRYFHKWSKWASDFLIENNKIVFLHLGLHRTEMIIL